MQDKPDPEPNCDRCPRLVAFRNDNQATSPNWHNAPVESYGSPTTELLVMGLAPGLQGANKTGIPFFGDGSGDLLYKMLLEFGFAEGSYNKNAIHHLNLTDCLISNAVRCVPPQNKPVTSEIKSCQSFLIATMGSLNNLKVILALGRVAHESILSALSLKKSEYPFKHNVQHRLPNGLSLFDSYHCSRYNINTRRLTEELFRSVFRDIKKYISEY